MNGIKQKRAIYVLVCGLIIEYSYTIEGLCGNVDGLLQLDAVQIFRGKWGFLYTEKLSPNFGRASSANLK